MEAILVTGGLGFIGSNLVKTLIKSPDTEVWIVDDYSNSEINPSDFFKTFVRNVIPPMSEDYNPGEDPKNPKLIFVEADCNHPSVLNRVKSGYFSKIFHLAAKPRVEWTVQNPIKSTDENFNKSIALAHAAALGKSKFIFASTAAVYGEIKVLPANEEWNLPSPNSPYGLSKYCSEIYFSVFENLYGLDWVSLRYFNVYGPGQSGNSPYATAVSAWCHKALNKQPLRSDGDGEQTRDMVHVDDVVSANMFIANNHGTNETHRIFNVGSGTSVSNNEILKTFSERGYTNVTHAPERPGDVRHTLADIRRIRALGWEPQIKFDSGLKSVLDYWEL